MLGGLVIALALVGVTIAWRQNSFSYQYDVRLSSPDDRYDLFVLRGDKAAFDDFFYRVYVVPRAIAPLESRSGSYVSMKGIWRDTRYLAYSGYAVPALRWTSAHEIEIDLDDLYDEVDEFHPVPALEKKARDSSTAVLVSLMLNKVDARNAVP